MHDESRRRGGVGQPTWAPLDAGAARGQDHGPTASRQGGAAPAAGFTANGRSRASRAAQFMPFAALTGYYELARRQERITEERHELTEDEAIALSRTITQIKKGDLVRVTYYDWDAYRTVSGMVARIDTTFRRLQVVQTVIPFDDIRNIERDAHGTGHNGHTGHAI